jgi:hypothetical protein
MTTPKFVDRKRINSDFEGIGSHYVNNSKTPPTGNQNEHTQYLRVSSTKPLTRDYSAGRFVKKPNYFYDPSIEDIERKYGIKPKEPKEHKDELVNHEVFHKRQPLYI